MGELLQMWPAWLGLFVLTIGLIGGNAYDGREPPEEKPNDDLS